ncbi:MAG: SocA family protein [Candidatus Omnitrophica bacterium]|nr:SocA family protein [Candidatus Omnitrophota bacterium]
MIEDYISSKQKVDEYSGFSGFDLDKMINMIVYVTEKTKGVFTTKLNKLLWYIDFLNFKECSKSISGSNYVHLPLGPVPDDYKWIIATAIEDGLIEEEEVILSPESAGIKYTSSVSAEESFFSEKEKKIMDFVIDYFKDYNCSQIKEKSHEEKAYRETKNNEKISYKYAASLSVSLTGN